MASADLRDELTCSICLNIYTDPVTLSCGHSFCRVCITKAWDKGEKKEYVCAKCNQRFKKRPRLHRNLKLSKIAERFQSPHQDQKDIGIPCTYCIHAPVPAVKSCLLCEASLCEKHLNIHSKSVEHILMEPITSFENRKCSVHKEILKYYCSKDDVCICVSCRLDGEHKGHQVESLEQVSEKKKKLRNILEKLTSERKKAEKRVQSLMVRKEEVHKETDVIKELLNNMILDLKERLKNLEKEVLSEISKKEKQLNLQISEQIQKLEIEKEELSKKMSHIEGLCNVTDPVTVLREQESNSKYGCDAKKGNDQGSEKDYSKLLGLENPDLQLYSSKIFTGLNSIQLAIERWDEVRQASDYYRQENMYSGKLLKADTELDSIKDIQITDDILLDINTASNEILVSSDLRTVMNSNKHQGRTETPKRFQNYCPQVFSIKSFSSGQHYWEVETAKLAHIRVGVAYPSIDRKGHDSMIGTNTKSWCVERVDVQYKALNNNHGILLPHCASGNVIGIYLDYDAGRLSFYERSNSVKHLHTFTVTFKEPLHLLFWVLDEFIKIIALKH